MCVIHKWGFGVLYCILSYLHLYFKCDQIPSIYGGHKIVIFIVLHFILGEKGTNHLVRSMKRYIVRDFFFDFRIVYFHHRKYNIWGVQLRANVKFHESHGSGFSLVQQ